MLDAEYITSQFVALVPETDSHDMLVGPCKCGAWHERAGKVS